MSKQKDKCPELRKQIDLIFDGCYSKDLSACPNHTIFQRGKAVNEILPLIEEAYKEGYEKAQANLHSPEIKAIVEKELEEAKREERERIFSELGGHKVVETRIESKVFVEGESNAIIFTKVGYDYVRGQALGEK